MSYSPYTIKGFQSCDQKGIQMHVQCMLNEICILVKVTHNYGIWLISKKVPANSREKSRELINELHNVIK